MRYLALAAFLGFMNPVFSQEALKNSFSWSGKFEMDGNSEAPYASTIRRLRLTVNKDLSWRNARVKSTFDLVSQGFRDCFIDFPDFWASGNMRVGHFREPISVEAMTSADDILFMERSLLTDFTPGRNLGAMWSRYDSINSVSTSIGAFFATSRPVWDGEDGGERALSITGRQHWHSDSNQSSAGIAASLRAPTGNGYLIDLSGEISGGTELLSPIFVEADLLQQISAEAVSINGPLTALAEAMLVLDQGGEEKHLFMTASAQIGYLLWGQDRQIEPGRVSFKAPKNKALEVAARSSWADLNSRDVGGGVSLVNSLALSYRHDAKYFTRLEWNRLDVVGGETEELFQFRIHIGL